MNRLPYSLLAAHLVGGSWNDSGTYESLKSPINQEKPTQAELDNIHDLVQEELNHEQLERTTRSTKRTQLREKWNLLPPWIRGPYRTNFISANELLDEHDDEAAIEMINFTLPIPGFTDEQIAIFNHIKEQFIIDIQNLNK
jgi:hypothetical protein